MARFLNFSKKERSRPIYRIVSYERLIELFDRRRNVLVNPGLWDDPYENFILRSKVKVAGGKVIEYGLHNHVYGQCWSFHRVSDAMWRLYSDGTGVRIKTTAERLLSSLYHAGIRKPEMSCGVGKVRYLDQRRLMKVANSTYGDSSVDSEKLFHSLLVKRLAFGHEREVRLLYFDVEESQNERIFSYPIDPHDLISQIMLDPRTPISEMANLKAKIRRETSFGGEVKRSLLYAIPDFVLGTEDEEA